MGLEIQFKCTFCFEPLSIPIDLAGKRVRCPFCKNPVLVPRNIKKAVQQQVQKKEAEIREKDIEKIGRKGFLMANHIFISSTIKVIVVIGLIYLGYEGYVYFKKQAKKDIPVLLKEYSEGQTPNRVLILNAIKPEHLGFLLPYIEHKDKEVRSLVAEAFGKIHSKEVISPLSSLLKDKDIEVQQAAAASLGNIYNAKVVDILIEALKQETSEEVIGDIGRSLRKLTGQRFTVARVSDWETWWKQNRDKFKFSQD